ncbi:MAG: polysaccharide deacetylase family protein [Candidatus Saccharimonadales bacterium]
MRKARRGLSIVVRPQLWVGVAAVCVLLLGIYWPATPVTPARETARPPAAVEGITAPQPVLPRPLIPAVDCGVQACLALTFDDGPNSAATPLVLDALERHHARATFFVLGNHVPGNEALLRRMYQNGHEIGNHSWSHPDFTTLNLEQMQQQITQTQAVVMAAGLPAPTLFRPPYGAVNAVVKNRIPMTLAMWNVDPEDWRTKDPKKIIATVEAGAARGRVVDLHDTHQPTADSLDQLVVELQQQYQLVTFSELFDLVPGQPGVFYGR